MGSSSSSTGRAPDKALAQLQQWLAHPGNRATLLERPERALAEYAALPVRRFSNAHTEKAAGYVRSPSTTSMDSIGYWLQAEAIHAWAAHGADPGPAWNRAAAWRLWGMAVQCARLEGGEITNPHILSDKAAEVLYLLAAVGDRLRCEQWGRRMLALRDAGHLPDAGSKSGPFALSLLTHWLTPAAARPVGAFCMPGMVDTSGACTAYQGLVDHLRTDSASPALATALHAAADAHQRETRVTTDEESFDFDAFHDMVVAMELLGWVRIRTWLGHAPPPDWPAPPLHAASALPAGWWGVERPIDASDPLLTRVMHRVQQVLPGRDMLAREFAPLPPPAPPSSPTAP